MSAVLVPAPAVVSPVALVPPALLRSACGRVIPLHIDRWFGRPAPEEERVLGLATGPVLDIGCGPARHVLALIERGVMAVGIDNAPSAVRAARERGAPALLRSVFNRVPREGRWGSALLLDGNVGIGGDPERLLHRVHAILRPGGRVVLESEGPGAGSLGLTVRAELGEEVASDWFGWALVGADEVASLAEAAGFAVTSLWTDGGRWFASLEGR